MICAALPFFPQVCTPDTQPQSWEAGANPIWELLASVGFAPQIQSSLGARWGVDGRQLCSLSHPWIKSQVLHWSVQTESRNVLKIKHMLSSNGKYLSKNAVNCTKVFCKRTVIYHETTLLERTAVIRNKLHWPLLQGLKAGFFGAVETHLPSSKGWIKMLCLT